MRTDSKPRCQTLLVFSQVFIPDPASVGQHMADVATEMARRGYRVRVYCSARGYEDPTIKYPRRETINGVEVRRFPLASFGKRSIPTRIVGTFAFMVQALWAGLFTPNVCGIFFSTSPPLIGIIASLVGLIRRIPIAYWAMDLNPDQLIALGKLPASNPLARLLEAINLHILRRSALVIALDRFMAARIEQRDPSLHNNSKMRVMPPWPHEENLPPLNELLAPPANTNHVFRTTHGLQDKFVVMYSGNHSPSNPLRTLLDAAIRLKDVAQIKFVFVGGGLGKKEVEATIREHALTNALSLPYQPLSNLNESLSSADLHVVSLGDHMVGIVHPCKIYGAMAVARPVLYLGPRPSHITDLLDEGNFGWQVSHGDVDGAVRAIEAACELGPEGLREKGRLAHDALSRSLTQKMLCGRLCDNLEQVLCRNAHCSCKKKG